MKKLKEICSLILRDVWDSIKFFKWFIFGGLIMYLVAIAYPLWKGSPYEGYIAWLTAVMIWIGFAESIKWIYRTIASYFKK